MSPRCVVAGAVAGALLAGGSLARAQIVDEAGNFSVQRLRPSASRDGVLGVESGRVGAAGGLGATAWLLYSNDPLVAVRRTMGTDDEVVGSLVKNHLELDLGFGYNVIDRLQVFAGAQLILLQDRDTTIPDIGGELRQLESTGVGGIQLGARWQLVDRPFDLALVPAVMLYPLSHNYFGEDGPVWRPGVAVSKTIDKLRAAFELTYVARKRAELLMLVVDDELEYDAGVAYEVARTPGASWELQAALAGAFAVDDPFGEVRRTPLEALAGLRVGLEGNQELLLGAGAGFNRAFGNPAIHLLAGYRLSYEVAGTPPPAPPAAPLDSDQDGIIDVRDGAPHQPEDKDGFEDEDGVPDLDNDDDRVPDEADACPLIPGSPRNRGCVLEDRDGDKLVDLDDACPDEAGLEELKGCPDRDQDGDTVVDRQDKCPSEAGVVEHAGCPPPKAVLTDKKIEITENVQFVRGSAELSPKSTALLEEIARILQEHPAVKLRIEGHTDITGKAVFNWKLSRRRAESVRTFLVERGIAADRLRAAGFGPSRPVASNETDPGRAQNRRVEFIVAQ